jgi:tRNA (Thr-GGU) A37 N-methylase
MKIEVEPIGFVATGARHPRNNPAWPSVGIFAQRAKNRPNRIGTTICRLLGVEGTTLRVTDLEETIGSLDESGVLLRIVRYSPYYPGDSKAFI